MPSFAKGSVCGLTLLLIAPCWLLAQEDHMCKVDLNAPAYYASQSYQDFQTYLVPALRRVQKKHAQAYISYSVPFQDFWDLAGLTFIFGPAPPPCCTACPNAHCSPDITFERTPGTAEAYFKWDSKQSQGMHLTKQLGDLQFVLDIPSRFEGWATVGPDLVHLYFLEMTPSLVITDSNFSGNKTVMFDDHIRCIGSSSHWATMRPFTLGKVIPHLPLVIDSK